MKKFAIILSGCGVFDGSEIHETVTTLLAIKKYKSDYQIFAPDYNQTQVINHITGQEMDEKRNILIESARIARGNIKNLNEYQPENFDGIIFPGGFGVAKNFCDYAFKGVECQVNTEIVEALQKTIKAEKLIGAECISPVMIAAVLKGATVTIGTDSTTAMHIAALNGKHVNAQHDDVVYDPKFRLFTTPCYMNSQDILQVWESAEAMVKAMVDWKEK
ncbi:MAG: isoprenoid biosynthesis glyoxalase ElbB [Bacteroidales bacterium]|nr:isoprenoid biosynthesis glyoxalase ElbB [Bacteroidales bacterium]